MSQSDKPEPPQESPTTVQGKAAQWARTCLGWIPGSSYILGSSAPTSSTQTKVTAMEESEEDEVEEVESTSDKESPKVPVEEETPEKEKEEDEEGTEESETGKTEPNTQGESQEAEKEKVEETPEPVLSEEDKEEQARLKEQTRKVEALRKKFEGVASKLIAVLGKLKQADFKAMPETADMTREIAGYRSSLKKSLSQSHQLIANNSEEIEATMDKAEDWAIKESARLGVLSTRKAELEKALAEQLDGAKNVGDRGDADDKSDVTGAVDLAKKKANKALAALDFERAEAAIKSLEETLEAITKQIEEKLAAVQKRVEGVESGDYARVWAEANEDYRSSMEGALAAAKSATTLEDAEDKLERLKREIAICDENIQTFKKATAVFPGVKEQYKTIQGIKPEDLKDPTYQKALTKLQERLEEEWGFITEFQEENQWESFASSVIEGSFPSLLADAIKIVDGDGKVAKAIAAAKEEAEKLKKEAEAAAKLAAEKLAEENRQRREDNKKLGLEEGERLFGSHSNPIIKSVWKVTKSSAPSATNTSIGGAYGYNEIMTAIGMWGGTINTGLFSRTFVPGGGNIQDKRTKNAQRNEIQANFISDWEGNMINVHVNLRQSDWATYFPDRD